MKQRAPMKLPQRAWAERHHQGSPQGPGTLLQAQARQVCQSRGHSSSDGRKGPSTLLLLGRTLSQLPSQEVQTTGALGHQNSRNKVQKDGAGRQERRGEREAAGRLQEESKADSSHQHLKHQTELHQNAHVFPFLYSSVSQG